MRAPIVRGIRPSLPTGSSPVGSNGHAVPTVSSDDVQRKYLEIWGELLEQNVERPVHAGPMPAHAEPNVDLARIISIRQEAHRRKAPSSTKQDHAHAHKRDEKRTRSITATTSNPTPQHASTRLQYTKDRKAVKHYYRPLPYGYTKFITFRPSRTRIPYSSSWNRRFARLNLPFDDKIPADDHIRNGQKPIREFKHLTLIETMAKANNVQEMKSRWLNLGGSTRSRIWEEFMIEVLYTHPDKAINFLVATSSSQTPTHAITDCLEYIVRRQVGDSAGLSAEIAQQILPKMLKLVNSYAAPLSQNTVFHTIQNLDVSALKTLYLSLTIKGISLHQNTRLQFTSRLAKLGDTEAAMRMLGRLYKFGADFSKPGFESVCATVLAGKYRKVDDFQKSDIFASMLFYGLQPNIIFYNTLLQNAILADDPDTAWRIHDLMEVNGVKPDAHTYSHLLNDAKWRLDEDVIKRILNIIQEKQIKSPHVTTDLLHAIILIHQRQLKDDMPPSGALRATPPFKSMLSLYSQVFDIQPIRDIAPKHVIRHNGAIRAPPNEPMTPPLRTLVVMCLGLLCEHDRGRTSAEFYGHLRHLLQIGNETAIRLASSEILLNAIILALGENNTTLPLCTEVIRDMLDGIPPDAQNHRMDFNEADGVEGSALSEAGQTTLVSPQSASTNSRSEQSPSETDPSSTHPRVPSPGSNIVLPKPSVHTWTILLKAFMSHNQPRAAEKVLAMMRSRGIEPNQITWNTLLHGYAKMQDVQKTVDVINRFQSEGWEADAIATRGLEQIKDRAKLIEAVKAAEREKKGDENVEATGSSEGTDGGEADLSKTQVRKIRRAQNERKRRLKEKSARTAREEKDIPAIPHVEPVKSP
jgi:pentatricopeptide repeat protein